MTLARIVEAFLFGGRWLIVPVYVAMLGLLAILVTYFIGELVHAIPDLPRYSENDLIILTLSLIDLSLAANLVVLVTLSGYENFVRRINLVDHDTWPKGLVAVDFSALKLKTLASVTVIAAVHLLRSFLEIRTENDRDLLWQVVIVVTFGGLSLLLAATDRLSAAKNHNSP
ncbi:MAG: YqhA family protein [Acidocella sp.]|uniref:YqhA family protein n=1 Tax=Acidocella sp. TaxID=50710 RepID=UPI003FBF9C18